MVLCMRIIIRHLLIYYKFNINKHADQISQSNDDNDDHIYI